MKSMTCPSSRVAVQELLSAPVFLTVTMLVTAMLMVPTVGAAEKSEDSGHHSPELRYLGPDGGLLPFTNHDEVVKFLRTARVVEYRELSSGSTRPLKVKLSRKGVQANAIFRSIEVDKRSSSDSSGRHRFRDSFAFEIAAYELNRLLGLDNIPPVVEREVNGRMGSLQLWIEQARSETERIESRKQHEDPDAVELQKMSMRVFDNLIHNFDRNTGNILIDSRGKLWWIDHTRSFKNLPTLLKDRQVSSCDRRLWRGLNDLDTKMVRKRLRPYLDGLQIRALLERRKKLMQRISDLIDEEGESTVLFEAVEHPATASVDSSRK